MQSENIQIEEAAAVSKSVENVFRKIIRFLVGRISLVKLQEIVRYIFIEEIENSIRQQNPSKNIPLTKLALLSGLDTRTLSKIRNSDNYRRPFHEESHFLKEFAPGASIIDYWCSVSPYLNLKTGKPRKLKANGKYPSFESLFGECTRSRGITHTSMLSRLVESGTVHYDDESQLVELVARSYLPSDSQDTNGAIEMGFSAIGNLTDTVTKNIDSLANGADRLFQQGTWSYRINPIQKEELRAELRILLESTNKEARNIIRNFEEPRQSSDHITAGIGSFYFEELAKTKKTRN